MFEKMSKVAVLVGSLRKESLNLKFARLICKMSPPSLQMKIIEPNVIGSLPFFNEDLEASPPKEWVHLRQELASAGSFSFLPFFFFFLSSDAFLFVTPEYNRGLPAALKNAIDVGSRPYGKNLFNAKPGAVASISIGGAGGMLANHSLRQSLVFLNVITLQQPEVYFNGALNISKEGDFNNDASKKFVQGFVDAFAKHVAVVTHRHH